MIDGITGYNERLFSGGLRQKYHMARFKWLRATAARVSPSPLRALEIGCFDGRALGFLPPVERYVGLDANWEGGLDAARTSHAGQPAVEFIETRSVETLRDYSAGAFNLALSLETLEHIDPAALDAYLAEVARLVDGPFLVTVPNEIGPLFLGKYLAKAVLYGDTDNYSPREVIAATLGQSHKVARSEHKGFDYRRLVDQLRCHFSVDRVEGISGIGLPPILSPTVGIVASSR